MTSTIVATKKFTVDLTKAELDSIQKQFLNELDEMLDKVRTTTTTTTTTRGVRRRGNGDLTDFKVDALHVASGLGDVNLLVMLRIRDDGEDLGREPKGVAVIVLRLGGLACSLVERRAGAC
jgi:hypothetical protein